MHVTTRAVPVGDIEIACTVVGEGAPLVVLHGAMGLGSTYMRALDSWAEEFQLGFTDITAATVRDTPERVMSSLSALDPMRTYGDIRCPTLVVHSELDPIPAEWGRLLADTIPESDYVLIENGSRFSMIEDAVALRSAVVPWLRKHTT